MEFVILCPTNSSFVISIFHLQINPYGTHLDIARHDRLNIAWQNIIVDPTSDWVITRS